eukprot:GFYU01002213.1.p1 GENE.GFYU01002213.1~~GFYU01002213.1.p1  ORF type:complete len:361 (+),score=142.44 GFYU01002213.1:72-1154(+)
MRWLIPLFITAIVVCSLAWVSSGEVLETLQNHQEEDHALEYIQNLTNVESYSFNGCIAAALERGWWTVAKELISVCKASGIDVSAEVRRSVSGIRTNATQILDLAAKKEAVKINPVFKWAQSNDTVFLEVKFGRRLSGPPAVLSVMDEKVTFGPEVFSFLAKGDAATEQWFELNVQLWENIIPEESTYVASSVGRMQFNLKKAAKEVWERLYLDDKPENMHFWWEMHNKYEEDLGYLKASQPKKKKKKKHKKKSDEEVQAEKEESARLKRERKKKKVVEEYDKEVKKIKEDADKAKKAADDTWKNKKKEIKENQEKKFKEIDDQYADDLKKAFDELQNPDAGGEAPAPTEGDGAEQKDEL